MNEDGDFPWKDIPQEKYPPELYTATKAEYLTMLRTAHTKKQRKGCPLTVLLFLLKIMSVFGITQFMR